MKKYIILSQGRSKYVLEFARRRGHDIDGVPTGEYYYSFGENGKTSFGDKDTFCFIMNRRFPTSDEHILCRELGDIPRIKQPEMNLSKSVFEDIFEDPGSLRKGMFEVSNLSRKGFTRLIAVVNMETQDRIRRGEM